MNKKIMWLAFYVTTICWLGSALGCSSLNFMQQENQNYKANLEQHDLFDQRYDPNRIGASASDAVKTITSKVARPTVFASIQTQPRKNEIHTTKPIHPDNSVDRTAWPRIRIRAIGGETSHYPHYFNDYLRHLPKGSTLDFDASIEVQTKAILGDAEASGLTKPSNLVDVVVQPFKFFIDLVALPIRSVSSQPFWKLTSSPKK